MKINKISDSKVQILHEETINAPMEKVFPLACPVLEYKWIPGWKCQLVHCPSGYVEQGTIFNEIMSAPMLLGRSLGKTTWTALYYSAQKHHVHYELRNEVSVSLDKLEFDVLGPNKVKLRMDLTYEALNEKGREIIRNHGGEKIGFMQAMLASMLKHYCEEGEIISIMDIKKNGLRSDLFSEKEKFQLAINTLAMKIMKDENRKQFLQGKPVSDCRTR